MTNNPEIKVGDTYWVFDINRRRYKKDDRNLSRGTIIYREHFSKQNVIGETSRSWLVGYELNYTKVPKNNPWATLFTAEMVEENVWVKSHRVAISYNLRHCTDVTKIRAIADILEMEFEND